MEPCLRDESLGVTRVELVCPLSMFLSRIERIRQKSSIQKEISISPNNYACPVAVLCDAPQAIQRRSEEK